MTRVFKLKTWFPVLCLSRCYFVVQIRSVCSKNEMWLAFCGGIEQGMNLIKISGILYFYLDNNKRITYLFLCVKKIGYMHFQAEKNKNKNALNFLSIVLYAISFFFFNSRNRIHTHTVKCKLVPIFIKKINLVQGSVLFITFSLYYLLF